MLWEDKRYIVDLNDWNASSEYFEGHIVLNS